MEKADPPSPTPSGNNNKHSSTISDDVLQAQFQQLIQHNASVPPVDVHSQISSNPHSRYSSPAPPQQQQQQQQPQQQLVMSMYDHTPAFNGYQQNYHMEPSPYPQLPDTNSSLTPHNAYSTPATSPPTPLQTEGITTRSGRAINRAREGTPIIGSKRAKRQSPMPGAGDGTGAGVKKSKKKKSKVGEPLVVLDAPLSVLAKDITTVQDTNIEEYVNRGPEVRQREVRDSKDGKVKRPMNAFMLYRKAFQNRTKEWKKYDNHQIISRICGKSWAMESAELRDQFDMFAKIERTNHRIAFPDYKFAPAKAKSKKGAANGRAVAAPDSEDDGSDLEGYEWDISAPPSRGSSRAARPMYDPDAEYRPPGMRTAYPQYADQSPMMPHARLAHPAHPSSFHHSNPGKPRPAEYGVGLGQGQYYQQTSEFMRPTYPHHISPFGGPLPNHVTSFVENVYMNKANSPVGSYHSSPIDHYGDMMGSAYPPPPHPSHHQPHPSQRQIAMAHQRINDHPIDPSLMSQPGTEQFDALGILGFGAQGDGMSHYTLDHGPLGAHMADDGGHHGGQQQQQQQQPPPQFDPTYQPHHSSVEGGAEPPWHDGPSMPALHDEPKLDGGEWETLAAGTDFDIDGILGTTDSPGG